MSDVVLRTDRLHLSRGRRPILTGVTLDVARGELVALMGPSGSGKTTILRAVAGLERFDTGTIVVDGVALAGGAPIPPPTLRQLRRKVGMVFQFHCLFEHLSALSNVCLAPVHAHGVAPVAAPRADANCSPPSAWSIARRGARGSSRAAKPSGWRSRARWPSIHRCC